MRKFTIDFIIPFLAGAVIFNSASHLMETMSGTLIVTVVGDIIFSIAYIPIARFLRG